MAGDVATWGLTYMAGRRIRCLCGTVFDPAEQSTCPACGASPGAQTTGSATIGTTNSASDPIGRDDRSFFERNRTLVAALGGAAGLLVVAFLARPFFVRPDPDPQRSRGGASAGESDMQANDDFGASVVGDELSRAVQQDPSEASKSAKAVVKSGLAAFEGRWRLLMSNLQPEMVVPGIPITGSVIKQTVNAAMTGPDAETILTVDANGIYELNIDASGSGLYSASIQPEKYPGTVVAQGDMTLTPNGYAATERTHVLLMPATSDMPHIQARKGDLQMSMQGESNNAFQAVYWLRPGGSEQANTSVVGTWTNHQVFIDSFLPYRGTLELRDAGDFRIRFTRSERGMLVVNDGGYEFKRSIAMGPPVQGRYAFDGADRFTLTEPRGSATWERVSE